MEAASKTMIPASTVFPVVLGSAAIGGMAGGVVGGAVGYAVTNSTGNMHAGQLAGTCAGGLTGAIVGGSWPGPGGMLIGLSSGGIAGAMAGHTCSSLAFYALALISEMFEILDKPNTIPSEVKHSK